MVRIVSSKFLLEHAQKDGRRFVQEYHTDDKGVVHKEGYYLAAAGADYDAVMRARVPQVEAQIAEAVRSEKYAADEDSAQTKLDTYVARLSDDDAKRLIRYTDDELATVRERL